MLPKTCSISECEKPTYRHTWCGTHYTAKWKLGELPPRPTLDERFWAAVNKTDGCWLWTGVTARGYGTIHADGKTQSAHRLAWSWANNCPMPPRELQVDHTCHVRHCVNPDHLRLVTSKQNNEHLAGVLRNNTSGYLGVSWYKRQNKWCAQVKHNGKKHFLGYFTDVHEAGEATKAKRLELFTHNDQDRK